MVEGKIVATHGMGSCKHEVDTGAFPEWVPKLGKVWICKLCGARVHSTVPSAPPLGKRVRISKKERRRQKAQAQERLSKEVEDTLLYGQPLDERNIYPKKNTLERV
jgi:hypothetical protein